MKIIGYIILLFSVICTIGYCVIKSRLSQTTWGGWTPDEEELLAEDYSNDSQETKESDTSTFVFQGTYAARVETDPTTTGMAQITYQFTFRQNTVQLKTTTYHEPIQCNGTYKMVEENNQQALYYMGNEAYCDKEKPLFFLKEKNGNLFARGLGGEGTFNEWIQLKIER